LVFCLSAEVSNRKGKDNPILLGQKYQFILPKTWENASVSFSSAYKIIGNTVPCVLAYHIAMRMAKNWGRYFDGRAG